MAFEYKWSHNEANFGPPTSDQIPGGCHISFEIILKFQGNIVALRRPNAIPGHELPPSAKDHPEGLLYFCHNLIRYGESIENFIARTVQEQAGVAIQGYRILTIESDIQQKDQQWAFTPYVIADLELLPSSTSEVTEVIQFRSANIPADFGWWTKDELLEFLTTHNLVQ